MFSRAFLVILLSAAGADAFFSGNLPSVSLLRTNAGRGRFHSGLQMASKENVLIIGGTRFSGAYLWKELQDRGHHVTLYNRGKTSAKAIPGESEADFEKRKASTTYLKGDRTDPEQLKSLIDPSKYTYVYDMNGREAKDTKPLAEMFVGSALKAFIYMSSAGVYKKSDEMPHFEVDAVDHASRHKGKLETEDMLRSLGPSFNWCSIRPTYICGPQNYNPVEEYFFERVDQKRPVIIPGHGDHLTGLGHVKDLARAMANVIGRESVTKGQIYNIQNTGAITFAGAARTAAKVVGITDQKLVHYNPKEFEFPEGAKAFPMRPVHFFTNVDKARKDLQWEPEFNSVEAIFADSYKNDFVHKKAAGKLKGDFRCDDMVIARNAK